MAISTSPGVRAAATGVAAAGLLIGAFALGSSRSGGAAPAAAATLTSSSSPGRITVTGTGTVTGVPNQLVLSMGVQVNGANVTSALTQANQAVRRVTAALRARGVLPRDIQTSGMSISPNYNNNNEITGYNVSESLTATLNRLAVAGAQIQAAALAGGNAVTIEDVSLNLTDTGKLMAAARTAAVNDAKAKAEEFAKALNEPLGGVISLSQVTVSQPLQYGFATPQASKAAGSVPVSPGTQQLSVSVTVVYGV
jgi:uncharacterized protein